MTLKTAATLALIGTMLMTVLLAIDFVDSVLSVARGLIPAIAMLRSLIYLVASLTVTVFFYVFNRGNHGDRDNPCHATAGTLNHPRQA